MNYKELFKKLDLSPIGLNPADNSVRYYCTPVDADIFARGGVDGIHYCTIPAYGDMVFCVDPSGCHEPEVFPVAESMEYLVRELLAGGDMWNLVEADTFCDETEFQTNVDTALMEEDVQATLALLKEATGLEPVLNLYEPLLLLRQNLDYSHIQFSEEYWELKGAVTPCEAEGEEYAVLEDFNDDFIHSSDLVFECHKAGAEFEVTHPLTGTLHPLRVIDCHPETLERPSFYGMEMPSRFYLLTCTMNPEPEVGSWSLRPLNEGDERFTSFLPDAKNAATVGIIGGADGPTAIFLSPSTQRNDSPEHFFCSSLHFTPPAELQWELVWSFQPSHTQSLPFTK